MVGGASRLSGPKGGRWGHSSEWPEGWSVGPLARWVVGGATRLTGPMGGRWGQSSQWPDEGNLDVLGKTVR